MLKIGLTGGIGSGKTTVAKIFELLAIPVYYADEAARRLMIEDSSIRAAIEHELGEGIYKNNELDSDSLARKVFNDPAKLHLLNSIVHPATIRDAARWMSTQKTPFAIKEAALIFESGSATELDYVIGVDAPVQLRIKRTMDRAKITYDEVLSRINSQLDENIKMKLCDFVVRNDEQQLLTPQVLALHQTLLNIAGRT